MKYILIAFVLVSCTADPKPGEIWRYEHVGEDKNPFSANFGHTEITETYDSVIAVKDGWVEYTMSKGIIHFYCTIHDFEIEANKIR